MTQINKNVLLVIDDTANKYIFYCTINIAGAGSVTYTGITIKSKCVTDAQYNI